jgi:hypothetical protein
LFDIGMAAEKYISLGVLAQETGLPKALLKRYAREGKIPALLTSKTILCKPSSVLAALDRIASEAMESGGRR